MRKRIVAVGLGALLGASAAQGQQPIPIPPLPTQPGQPASPGLLPPPPSTPPGTPAMTAGAYAPGSPSPSAPNAPTTSAPKLLSADIPLPHAEQKAAISAMDVSVKRVVGGWEVWSGQKVMRNTGDNETNARDMARVLRELRPTEWVAIGGAKPVVEYGLTNGRPAVTGAAVEAQGAAGNVAQAGGPNVGAGAAAAAKFVQQIDLRSARVEAIRGVWCVRDDNNILFNFGTDKAGAEQASAVIQKYGFNRVGIVGTPTQPVMSYLFVSLDQPPKAVMPATINAQMDALTRTGIPIPGVGFAGEMVKIDPRKVEVRKDGAEWVVAFGPEVLGRFGPVEWTAREAARTIQDAKFTEFCKLGGASDLTFFLANGKAPNRAPYNAAGKNFNTAALKVMQINQKWAVTDAGKQLFEVGSEAEGETVVRVLKAYGFDQTAHLSAGGTKGGIRFFVKNR